MTLLTVLPSLRTNNLKGLAATLTVGMQSRRMLFDVDQTVIFARDDATGIFRSAYLSSKWKASGIMSADSAAEERICEGRSAISFRKRSNLAGADLGTKIFAIMSGHISRLIMGETARVLSVEWKDGDARRMEIEIYNSGRWESRLKTMVHPRPWLERWRALVTFTGSSPRQQSEKPSAQI